MYEEGANLSESSNNKRIEINFKTVLLLGLSYFVVIQATKVIMPFVLARIGI